MYDLPSDKFGMSAEFNFPEALEVLQPILYGEQEGSDGTTVGEQAAAAATEALAAGNAEAGADAVADMTGSAGGSGSGVASIVDKQE